VTTKNGEGALVIAIEENIVVFSLVTCIVAAECFQQLGEDTSLIA
jgi:hypothetical protein